MKPAALAAVTASNGYSRPATSTRGGGLAQGGMEIVDRPQHWHQSFARTPMVKVRPMSCTFSS